jgi:hypothetical protein
MSSNFARPLHTNDLAFDFLSRALGLGIEEAGDAALEVMGAESLLHTVRLESTLESAANRHSRFKTDESRVTLRRAIFDDLISLERLDDDENIKLKEGGARPHSQIRDDKQAIILIGLPASGKSFLASQIAELYGAYIIDSDYAKRKFPEFKHTFGAPIVHEESSLVTFGSEDPIYADEFCLYEFCITKGFNMVIPKIGSSHRGIRKMRDALISKGYDVHLVLVSLDRQEACRRVLNRFLNTKRYVPLGHVFDGYGNEPVLTYYRTKNDEEWTSVGKLSTLELRDKGPMTIYHENKGPVFELKERGVAL